MGCLQSSSRGGEEPIALEEAERRLQQVQVQFSAAEARAAHCPQADWSPESLAAFTQAALQGAFVLAKAKGGPDTARAIVDHLRRHVEMLFGVPHGSGGLKAGAGH